MNVLCIFVVCVNIVIVNAHKDLNNGYINKLLKILKGRRDFDPDTRETNEPIETSLMIPGFYLVKPDGMSKSSFKHPSKKYSALYDRLDDLNTRYIKTKAPDLNESKNKQLMAILKQIKNIDERQANEKSDRTEERNFNTGTKNKKFLENIIKTVKNINQYRGNKKQLILITNTKPSLPFRSTTTINIEDFLNGKLPADNFTSQQPDDETENNASEVMDEEDDRNDNLDYRRQNSASAAPDAADKCDGASSELEASKAEKNPGNPFTIHKNKYKQNWLWNHYMDGDHMNINPLGPQFASQGPSGPDLFFGRKWWYFNQDDYKPMG